MQTGFDYTTLNYFMYAAIIVVSVFFVVVVALARRGLKRLKSYVCFAEVGRVRLGAVNKRWGDYFYRVEHLTLDEAMMVRVSPDGSFTQMVRVHLLDFFQWEPQQKEWYVFDGTDLIKYKRIKR